MKDEFDGLNSGSSKSKFYDEIVGKYFKVGKMYLMSKCSRIKQ